jgi:hypothetical protein
VLSFDLLLPPDFCLLQINYTSKLIYVTINTNHIYMKNIRFELVLVKYQGMPNYKQLFVNMDHCTTGKQL